MYFVRATMTYGIYCCFTVFTEQTIINETNIPSTTSEWTSEQSTVWCRYSYNLCGNSLQIKFYFNIFDATGHFEFWQKCNFATSSYNNKTWPMAKASQHVQILSKKIPILKWFMTYSSTQLLQQHEAGVKHSLRCNVSHFHFWQVTKRDLLATDYIISLDSHFAFEGLQHSSV